MNAFRFGKFDRTRVVAMATVPVGIGVERTLFDALYEQLSFPDYFGNNWNALEECLRDLSWLPPGDVAILHDDVPFELNPSARSIYFSILEGAVEKFSRTAERRLVVMFPEVTELAVRRALVQG